MRPWGGWWDGGCLWEGCLWEKFLAKGEGFWLVKDWEGSLPPKSPTTISTTPSLSSPPNKTQRTGGKGCCFSLPLRKSRRPWPLGVTPLRGGLNQLIKFQLGFELRAWALLHSSYLFIIQNNNKFGGILRGKFGGQRSGSCNHLD